MNSIEIKNLNKTYDKFKLSNINFTLPKGTIVGLVGENGAGKTTIINLIMNVISRDSGEISVLGLDNTSPSFTDLKQNIGIVLDECYFPPVLNIIKIEKIMAKTFTKWDSEYFYKLIQKFHLPSDKKVGDFSRGMKMKLSIAVSMSHSAKLLILDEATSGLDPMVRDEILDIFNEFTRDEENSILMSSHIVTDLEKICDYIAFVHNGELVLFDEKDEILANYALIKLNTDEFNALSENSVVSHKKTSYGFEALIYKNKIPKTFTTEYTSLEDIILYLSRR